MSDMLDFTTDKEDDRIEMIRERLASELPKEQQLLVAYLDARMSKQDKQITKMITVLQTGAGLARMFRWIAGASVTLAAIWGAIHGKITLG